MSDAKQIEEMNLTELLKQRKAIPAPGGSIAPRVEATMQVRLVQEASAQALVTATEKLGDMTSRLVYATWGLVGATLVLVLAEIVLKVFGRR